MIHFIILIIFVYINNNSPHMYTCVYLHLVINFLCNIKNFGNIIDCNLKMKSFNLMTEINNENVYERSNMITLIQIK